MGLLGTGCHRQLSDAVSKAAGTTMNPPPSVPSPDLKHPICQSEQADTGRTCVLIILRVAFPGTLSESQYARRMGAQSVYMPCGTPPQTLHSAPVTEFWVLPFCTGQRHIMITSLTQLFLETTVWLEACVSRSLITEMAQLCGECFFCYWAF